METAAAEESVAEWIDRKLNLARNYLTNEMNDKAAGILQEIIEKHPDAPETAEARKLLEAME